MGGLQTREVSHTQTIGNGRQIAAPRARRPSSARFLTSLLSFFICFLFSSLRNAAPVRNEDGDLVGRFDGEDVIFPDLEPTLEWVLTTPVELHLFEEAPILKCYQVTSTYT